jgi:hypothetical protein
MTAELTNEEINQQWNDYKIKYKRDYSEEEDKIRKERFVANLKMVLEHNKKYSQGLTTFRLAINHLSDRTDEERPINRALGPRP